MLGIDIGRHSVKLVAMTRRRQRWRMAGWVEHVCASGSDSPDQYQLGPGEPGPSAAVELAKALTKLTSAGRNRWQRWERTVICLSSNEILTRNLSFAPDVDEHDIENQVLLEADRQLPDPVSELSMDFCRLGPARNGVDSEVLMVACRRELVDSRCQLVADAGLRLAAVEVDALAYWRLLRELMPALAQNQALALIDTGCGAFRLHVFCGDRLEYSRSHTMATTTSALQLARDIQRALQLYQMTAAPNQTMKIVLTGGFAAHSPDLSGAIAGMCDYPVSLLWQLPGIKQFFRDISLASGPPPEALALACGLAMRQP